MATALKSAIQTETDNTQTPHLVVMDLQRRKVDANREINEATFGDPIATEAYETYHHYIELAKYNIEQAGSGHGLVLDIHGQTHPEAWTEFGYKLTADDLNNNRYRKAQRNQSTICSLVKRECRRSKKCFKKIVRKGKSLGERLVREGNAINKTYTAIPSKANPVRSPDEYNYFIGGYTVATHGSVSCSSTVDAIQIEMPRVVRFGGATERGTYVGALAKAVRAFMVEFYGWV